MENEASDLVQLHKSSSLNSLTSDPLSRLAAVNIPVVEQRMTRNKTQVLKASTSRASEQFNGVLSYLGASSELNNFLMLAGLLDAGFVGDIYTWTNKRIQKRLDRILTSSWNDKEFDVRLEHLNRATSDHCPLLISFPSFVKPIASFRKAFDASPMDVNRDQMAKCQALLFKSMHMEEIFWKQKATTRWIVLKKIWEMNEDGVAGPDWFSVAFYVACCNIIKVDVYHEVLEFFKGGSFPKVAMIKRKHRKGFGWVVGILGNLGLSSFGTIVRDIESNIVMAKHSVIGLGSNIRAKLVGILRGLELCIENNLSRMWLESDSFMALKIIKASYVGWGLRNLVLKIKRYIVKYQVFCSHVFREANDAVDHLANQVFGFHMDRVLAPQDVDKFLFGICKIDRLEWGRSTIVEEHGRRSIEFKDFMVFINMLKIEVFSAQAYELTGNCASFYDEDCLLRGQA
ncbi:hypothetical protein ZIOFF_024527 [Zingiber officinale]|uniref:RNase H type-1 domain-containing protein n=1 Tax=Zingiber officinale TaxID=94328 RepID=A0A8J5H2I4_ZINOF|nr:hypothetical protein ZIOFF_024527 [Zingiber officinale]